MCVCIVSLCVSSVCAYMYMRMCTQCVCKMYLHVHMCVYMCIHMQCVHDCQANEHVAVVTDASIQNFYLQEIPQHLEVCTCIEHVSYLGALIHTLLVIHTYVSRVILIMCLLLLRMYIVIYVLFLTT